MSGECGRCSRVFPLPPCQKMFDFGGHMDTCIVMKHDLWMHVKIWLLSLQYWRQVTLQKFVTVLCIGDLLLQSMAP